MKKRLTKAEQKKVVEILQSEDVFKLVNDSLKKAGLPLFVKLIKLDRIEEQPEAADRSAGRMNEKSFTMKALVRPCHNDSECPAGYNCKYVPSPGGGVSKQCVDY